MVYWSLMGYLKKHTLLIGEREKQHICIIPVCTVKFPYNVYTEVGIVPADITVKSLPLPTNLKIVTVTSFSLPAWKNFETVTSFSLPAPQKIWNG
jgi:hypothetical protein